MEAHKLFAKSEQDFIDTELSKTLYITEENFTKFIPEIMVRCGIVSSKSEVRRNRPDLVRDASPNDFEIIKWGKRRLYIFTGNI